GIMGYYTMPASTFTHRAGGVDMVFSPTCAYGSTGYTAAASNNPRGFVGTITFIPAVPCTGAPTGGVADATVTAACAGTVFNLSLNGATMGGGVMYQWQSSPQGAGTFTDIPGATSSSYNASQTAATDYRCIVTCTNSNSTATSTVVSVGQNPRS